MLISASPLSVALLSLGTALSACATDHMGRSVDPQRSGAVAEDASEAQHEPEFDGGDGEGNEDGGTRVRLAGPNCSDDYDGLDFRLEEDAGLDPCKADSDGDGCSDPQQFLLGGCDDARRGLATVRCFRGGKPMARLTFVAPEHPTAWSRLTLIVDPSTQVKLSELSIHVEGVDAGADAEDAASYTAVAPGTPLSFEVVASAFHVDDHTPVELELVDADGQVLDRGKIVTLLPECPAPNE